MKLIQYFLFLNLVFCSCVSQKNTYSFDYKSKSPIEFLDFLNRINKRDFFIVRAEEVPNNWIKNEHIQDLYQLTKSNKIITQPIFDYVSFNVFENEKIAKLYLSYEALKMLDNYSRGEQYGNGYGRGPFRVKNNDTVKSIPQELSQRIDVWYKTYIDSLEVSSKDR